MSRQKIFSELNNLKAIKNYSEQLTTIAGVCFKYTGMPDYIDMDFVNQKFIENGAVCFFKDDITGEYYILPFNTISRHNIYNNPVKIQAYGANGKFRINLVNGKNCVIIYDNMLKIPLLPTIIQYATRLALCTRVIDVNVFQQKTPRIFKTSNKNVLSLKKIINSMDALEEGVLTYEGIDLDDLQGVLNPVPYVSGDVFELKRKIFAEFLHYIGVTSVASEKAERMIANEIVFEQGDTFAFRLSRLNPRKNAFEKIKKMFGIDIKCDFYDIASYDIMGQNLAEDNNTVNKEGDTNDTISV